MSAQSEAFYVLRKTLILHTHFLLCKRNAPRIKESLD